MSDFAPQHECTNEASSGFQLLAACPGDGLSTGATIGIVVAVLLVLGVVGLFLYRRAKNKKYLDD
ncbi:MAG: hypothetical protein ACPGQL_10375 [Thermoplasmatota archaeon]